MTAQEISHCRSLLAEGKASEALERLESLASAHPDDGDVQHYLGLARHLAGGSAQALAAFERAAELLPEDAAVFQNMVLPLLAMGEEARAVEMAQKAVKLAASAVGARINLVMALISARRFKEARAMVEAGLALKSDDPVLLRQKGVILLDLKEDAAEAERCLRASAALKPDVETFYNLGVMLHGQARDREAVEAYRQALMLSPKHKPSLNNLAASFRNIGEVKRAERVLTQLLTLEDRPVFRFNRACLTLMQGDWLTAWADYEGRGEAMGTQPDPALVQGPRWQGETLAEGRLLVFHEQGLGDTLQFIRLLPEIAGRVKQLIFVCQPKLLRLLRSAPMFRDGRIALVPHGADLPAYDVWLPLLSLPGIVGLTPDRTGYPAPYLRVEQTPAEHWRSWLASLDGHHEDQGAAKRLKIGLVWQGNPKAYGEPGRSLPLAAFQPLATLGDRVCLISLQKGEGADQSVPEGMHLTVPPDLDPSDDAFIDTAALIASLDLVITSDTAVAHLAGALAKPVWMLLKKSPDWRWGLSGLLTDWYPTMRLFRQTEAGDWQHVMADVLYDLQVLLSTPRRLDPAPMEPEACLEEAVRRHQARDYAGALPLYRHVLSHNIQPDRVWNLTGMAMLEAGGRRSASGRQALPFCAWAVALRPAASDMWSNFAIALDAAGLKQDGMRALRHGLVYRPDHLPSQLAMARRETAAGKAEASLARVAALLKQNPHSAQALSVYAAAATALEKLDEAEAALKRAMVLEPELAAHKVQLGAVLLKKKQPQAARRLWEKALVLDPTNADAWSNLGVAERNHGLVDLAIWFQKQGARAQPDHAESWSNLGISLMDGGYESEAEQAFSKAIAARPNYADAEMALAMAYMNQGDYARGLPLYERRFDVQALGIDRDKVRLPIWQGEDLTGKSIFVLAEQGFGDAFQFCRYAMLLKQRGAAKVVVGTRRKIASLMATVPGIDGVIAESDVIPKLDYQVFMMSLPYYCGTTAETIPAFPAYLAADPERVTTMAGWLTEKPGFRVGLVWQGNPDPQVDKGRSFPLSVLQPLSEVPGVRLIALQKGPGEEQIDSAGFAVERPPEGFDEGPDAFADTAAMIMNLDLVITSDTAVAHLAGALGRPVWVLLKSHAEWRWLRGRADSPWYPLTRLFRRVTDEVESAPFAGVATRVAEALASLVKGDRSQLFVTEEPVVAVPDKPAGPARLAEAIRRHMAGEVAAAEAVYADLLKDEAMRAEALHMLGGIAVERMQYDRGYLLLKAAAELGLATPVFFTNFAIALRNVGRTAEAEDCLRKSLAETPSAEAYMTLGNLLRDTDRYDPALEAYHRAIELRPDLAKAHRGLGNALREMGRPEEAVSAFDEALRLEPGDAETLIDRAHAHLMAGNLQQGFRDYEARWKGAEMVERVLPMPRWTGESLPDKTLLIHGEQGLGDQIQFGRFVRQAALKVGRVVLELRDPLIELYSTLVNEANNITLRRQGVDATDDADCEAPIMSLPLILGTTLESLPGPALFRPDPRRVAAWEGRFGGREALRVGLIWQGNPHARADKGRSPPLKRLKALFEVENTHFISLQFRDGLEQVEGLDFAARMETPGEALGNFAETAAAIAALDLVISSCTSTLHLAASLGIPTFALLKYAADWRWMAGRTTSPWYPGLRIYRQPVPGDWESVAKAAAQDLAFYAERKR
ncbi:tetratricopeptide repeat protein [Allorhizobium sp. BGMRC 0089]|uniref:tetratricopeptide repeat protein n=1 Tax=Allorhizobium sonneratiae TaxID=2934936 RepID=UPI0020344048|nr:tetratricopeptide repeat protein [Allorhizobium sonneratiae]MCM2290768.1 tetratricopeptide repeat protein [Allorhizobium sonneratiae]